MNSDNNKSQGSVATHLRCGGLLTVPPDSICRNGFDPACTGDPAFEHTVLIPFFSLLVIMLL